MYSHSYLISNYVKTSNLHVQINVTISYRKVSISVNLVNIVSISYRSENPGIAHHYSIGGVQDRDTLIEQSANYSNRTFTGNI